MKRLISGAALALTMTTAAAPAGAGLLEFDAQLHAGGMRGSGVYGDRKSEAFARHARGLSYGGRVGVEFLFIDGWIEHSQYINDARSGGGGVNGTWTQFMIGMDARFPLGDRVGARPAEGESDERYTRGFGEIGLGIGFGVGTGQQVDLPLDNSELSDKGFVAQAHLDVGYRLSKMMSIGVHVPLQTGYLFRTEDDDVANDRSSHYGSIQGALLVAVRANLSLM